MSVAHPTIQQAALAAGWDLDDPHSVRQLQAHNWMGITEEDLELVASRVSLGSDEALGRAQGRRPSSAAQLVDHAVMRLIAPMAHEIPQWRARRDAGESDELIAAQAGTLEAIVRLALDGLPGRPRGELVEQQLAGALSVSRSAGRCRCAESAEPGRAGRSCGRGDRAVLAGPAAGTCRARRRPDARRGKDPSRSPRRAAPQWWRSCTP